MVVDAFHEIEDVCEQARQDVTNSSYIRDMLFILNSKSNSTFSSSSQIRYDFLRDLYIAYLVSLICLLNRPIW